MSYNLTAVTNAGNKLFNTIIDDNTKLTIDRVDVSATQLTSATNIKAMTQIDSVTQTTGVNAVSKGDASIVVKTVLSNKDIKTDYKAWVFGIYGHDEAANEETLLAVVTTTDTPDTVPAYDAGSPIALKYSFAIAFSNSANITINQINDEYAMNDDVVHITGDESIAGVKTFETIKIDNENTPNVVTTDGYNISLDQGTTKFVPANDAKVVHTTDSQIVNALQIRTFTGDFNTSNQTGIYNVPYKAGTYTNAPEGNIAGQMLCINNGNGDAVQIFTDSSQHEWRRHWTEGTSGQWQAWKRIPAIISSDGSINDGVTDIFLTKYGLGVADPVSEYWNSFRNRLKWESRPVCASGTDFEVFLKSNSVQTGFSIVRDGNTNLNWYIIKESTTWIYGWAITAGRGTCSLSIENGSYVQDAATSNLQGLNTVLAQVSAGNHASTEMRTVRRALTTSDNLNNIKTNGIFPFASLTAANSLSWPGPLNGKKVYGVLIVTFSATSSECFQELRLQTGEVYTRVGQSGGTDWSRAWMSHQGWAQAANEAAAKTNSANDLAHFYYTEEQ